MSLDNIEGSFKSQELEKFSIEKEKPPDPSLNIKTAQPPLLRSNTEAAHHLDEAKKHKESQRDTLEAISPRERQKIGDVCTAIAFLKKGKEKDVEKKIVVLTQIIAASSLPGKLGTKEVTTEEKDRSDLQNVAARLAVKFLKE